MLNKLYQDVFVDPFSFDSHLLKELVKTSLNVNGEKKIIKDVKDIEILIQRVTSFVRRMNFLGATLLKTYKKRVSPRSFISFCHNRSNILIFQVLNDSRSLKFGERSHTLVQICEFLFRRCTDYTVPHLELWVVSSGHSIQHPMRASHLFTTLVFMLLSSEVKMLADIAVSIVTVPPFSVLIDG